MLITDIINILGNEFSSIYCVNHQDQYIQIYRHLTLFPFFNTNYCNDSKCYTKNRSNMPEFRCD